MRAVNVDSYFAARRGYDLEQKIFSELGVQLELRALSSEKEIVEGARDADIVIVEHATTPFTRSVVRALPRCRLIAKSAIGVDNIDLKAASEAGILVCNAADYCVEEVSDHALALILACARRTFQFDRHVRGGGWHELALDPPLRRISQQTVGLVGFGRIARRVAEKLSGWKLRLLAFDPYLAPEQFYNYPVEAVSLPSLLQRSDYVSLHLPLTQETRHLVGKEELALMSSDSFLINTSRGPVVDEEFLIQALRSGKLAGAALDVTEEEPLPAAHPLRSLPNVLVTPHFGANSEEALIDLRQNIIYSVAAFVSGFLPPFVVNPAAASNHSLQPYGAWPGKNNFFRSSSMSGKAERL
jgi:D-3-phosphoglycerate dehydrogenase / 2-oxoglutarate reductase